MAELKAPPVDVKDALYGPNSGKGNPIAGILGTTLGESPEDAAARVEEAKKNANDLTGLVRHKKKPTSDPGVGTAPEPNTNHDTNGKRKAEDDAEQIDSKKAKVGDDSEV